MNLDSESLYIMPTFMGPLYRRKEARHHFRRISMYGLRYPVMQEAVQSLLPKGCTAPRDPTFTILFGYYDGVDFMGGGGYREVTLLVSARFDGDHDQVEGDFVLVMFLDDALPIIFGREQMGLPKLPATISSVKIGADGTVRCETSYDGHLLFTLDLGPVRDQIGPARMLAAWESNRRPWLCWKYIPSLEGPPDADYALALFNELKVDKLSATHTGRLAYGDASRPGIAAISPLLDALATLVPIGDLQGFHMAGSTVMRGDLSRRLR